MTGLRFFLHVGFFVSAAGLVPVSAAGAPDREAEAPKVDAAGKILLAADAHSVQGRYKMAIETYATFLKEFSGDRRIPDARYRLAVCWHRLKQYDKVVAELAVVVEIKNFKDHNNALHVLGYSYLILKDYPKAVATCERLMTESPKSKQAVSAGVHLIQALFFGDKMPQCAQACEAYVKAYPTAPGRLVARYFQGLSLQKLNKNAEAVAALAEIVKTPDDPRRVSAMAISAQCLRDLGKYPESEAMYRGMLKIAPTSAQAGGRYGLSLTLYDAGKFPEAVVECKIVLGIPGNPHISDVRMHMALAQWYAGNLADARVTLKAVAKNDKARLGEAQYWLARCDLADGKHAEARTALLALAKKKGGKGKDIAYYLGMCSLSGGQFAQGVADFEAYRKAYPKGPGAVEALYRQAFCLHQIKKYPECQALCEQVAKADPGPFTSAAAELSAENALMAGEYDQAGKAFAALAAGADKAKDDDRKFSFSVRQGQCAHLADQHERAVKLLGPLVADKRLTAHATLVDAILHLGESQLALEQYDAAAATIVKHLSATKRSSARARHRLGCAYLRGGKKDEAAKAFAAGMDQAAPDGSNDSIWVIRSAFDYGELAYRRDQHGKAAPALERVLASKVATPDLAGGAAYLLAWIDYRAKKYPEAAERFGKMAKAYPKHLSAPHAAYQQALATKQGGKHEEAIVLFQGYLKAHPADDSAVAARYQMSACLTALGKDAQAKVVLAALAADKKTTTETVLYDLAWAQRKTDEPEVAIATYHRLLKEYPDSNALAAPRTELCDLLYAQKEYEAAASLAEMVIADKAAPPRLLLAARYQAGLCYEKMGDDVKTAAAMSAFAAKYPNGEQTPMALYLAGVAETNLKKYAAATKHFSALVAGFPKDDLLANTYIKLGQVQNSSGKFAEAEATFSAYMAKFPAGPWIYMARFGTGWSLENRKKYPEARKAYTLVERIHDGPTAARAKYQIGQTYFAEGNYAKAAAELISVDAVYAYPKWSSKALLEAGNVFRAAKDVKAAKAQYAACVKKYPKSKEALLAAEELKKLGA